MKTPAFGIIAATLVFAIYPAVASAKPLASHSALYDMRLGAKSESSAFVSASGKSTISLRSICGGWITEQQRAQQLRTSNGDTIPEYVNLSSWEAKDSGSYRVSVTFRDFEKTNVMATAKTGPDGGQADFTAPEKKSFDLPKGTVFPVAHTRELLERAKKGETNFNRLVFEGTDLEGAKMINAFISPLGRKGRAVLAGQLGPMLRGNDGWTVRLAYFEPGSQQPEPMYEVESDILENGIVLRFVVDMGDFFMEGTMVGVNPLPDGRC